MSSFTSVSRYAYNLVKAPLVLNAITTTLPIDAPPPAEPPLSASASTSSDVSSPVVATPPIRGKLPVPRHGLDMLLFVLRNIDNPANFPVEVRVNVCSFLLQLGKQTSGPEWNAVQTKVRPTLEKIIETTQNVQGKEEMLGKAAKRVLDHWNST